MCRIKNTAMVLVCVVIYCVSCDSDNDYGNKNMVTEEHQDKSNVLAFESLNIMLGMSRAEVRIVGEIKQGSWASRIGNNIYMDAEIIVLENNVELTCGFEQGRLIAVHWWSPYMSCKGMNVGSPIQHRYHNSASIDYRGYGYCVYLGDAVWACYTNTKSNEELQEAPIEWFIITRIFDGSL